MEKTFDAATAEPRIYAQWEAAGAFAAGANASRAETFCIVIPPPNVTGSLHMGHALNNTLQDILVRWKRMQGYDVLWQPGTDHAGIATQMVVERALAAEGNAGRREMGREAFVRRVWQQKAESEGTILGQLKRLGASCDWSRNRFTMDEGLSAAVLKVFVQLYDEGLIFRGKRLVNWDPQFETAISDLEVENVEVDGHMWHFKYPLAGGETYNYVEKDEDGTVTLSERRDYISIATTRPETMLGDGAVAVHPSDARYAPIVGKLCEIPVGPKQHRRLIPIITDEYPDPDFGSGAVKITGAHDFNDYAVARRNGIPCYRLMDTKAQMRTDGAPYAQAAARALAVARGEATLTGAEADAINLVPDDLRGLDRYEARRQVVEQITAEGLAVTTRADDPRLGKLGRSAPSPSEADADTPAEMVPLVEARKIMAPYGDRSKVVIEPMLTDQWFVDAEKLAGPAIEAVRDGRTGFVPENWARWYYNWMENIESWCISRQLWWGHQVPVWYARIPDNEINWRNFLDWYSNELDGRSDAITERPKNTEFGWLEIDVCAQDEQEALEEIRRRIPYEAELEIVSEEWLERTSSIRGPMPNDQGSLVVPVWRDPDVLDTWFSSALWPFSTLGWPDETPELARYYKTDVLITGFDIIFFWVARMMMMGLHFMKDEVGRPEVPFHTVYINSIVVDQHGKKMSKSQGNVIDPLQLIDQYGADALRFTLAAQEVQGRRQLRLAVDAVQGGRNFGTKLWNAARFAEMNGCYGAPESNSKTPPPGSLHQTVNRWIVGETARTAQAVDRALAAYRFNEAAGRLYDHIWKVFCDWYVEFAKPLLQGEDPDARIETQRIMAWALDQLLALLHPIMPFITEALWGQLATRDGMLVHAPWPQLDPAQLSDPRADSEIDWVIRLIEGVRSVRAELNVPPKAQLAITMTGHSPATGERLLRNSALIERLAGLSECTPADEAPAGSVTLTLEDCAISLSLAGVIDIVAERARLEKTLRKVQNDASGLEKKLGNQGFLAKAPEEVVEEQRERLGAARSEAARLEGALARLASLG